MLFLCNFVNSVKLRIPLPQNSRFYFYLYDFLIFNLDKLLFSLFCHKVPALQMAISGRLECRANGQKIYYLIRKY